MIRAAEVVKWWVMRRDRTKCPLVIKLEQEVVLGHFK